MAKIARPRVPLLDDVLEEHLGDLEHLLARRRAALRSPEYTLAELSVVEGRIADHVDGLQIGGARTAELAVERLAGDDVDTVHAAAFALSHLDVPEAAPNLLAALLAEDIDASKASAIGDALCLGGGIARLADSLEIALSAADLPIAAAAAVVLAHAGRLDAREPRLQSLIVDGAAITRAAAWRAVALTDLQRPADVPRPYQQALVDDDAGVREAALAASVWTRQVGLREHCRASASPTPASLPALRMLAILGEPQDLEIFIDAAQSEALGPERFALLGSFGHPGAIDAILAGLVHKDARAAAAAALAFKALTGLDVNSGRRVKVGPPAEQDSGAEDEELFDEVEVPDAEKATRHWSEIKERYQGSLRWARGRDVAGPRAHEIAEALDLRTRWEANLRARFERRWEGGPVELERLTIG